jgi:hypothetical protein
LIVSYYLWLREDCLFTNLFSHVKQADAIMALAGSNGRSWSTTYSPQPNARATNSFSDGSLSALEREKDKSVQSRGGSLAVSSEVQTLLCRLSQNGTGSGRPT